MKNTIRYINKNIVFLLLIGVLSISLHNVSIARIDHHNNHNNQNTKHNETEQHETKTTNIEVINGITIAKIQTSAECDKCKKALEKAINRLDGIKSSNLDVESRVFTVKFKSDDISLEKIKSVINKTGYDADETKADPKAYDRLPDCCKVGGMD